MSDALDRLRAKVNSLEAVDWEQEAALQAIDVIALGEAFKDEMVGLMKTQDESGRYSRIKSMEFLPNGGIAKIEFHEPRTDAGAV